MEILLKEQLTSCECPYCTKEFVIVGLRNEAKQEIMPEQEVKQVKQAKNEKKEKKSRRKWTSVEDAALEDGLANGLSIKTIAKNLGRSYDVTYRHKQKLGLKGKNSFFWTASNDATLLEMSKKGISAKEIAKQLGKSLGAVYSRKYIIKRSKSK